MLFDNDLVTVIIPVYNRESTIKRAIESVLKQTYINTEIIIVDDHSKDGTVDIINNIKDSRIKLIQLEKQGGANTARNAGIAIAKGKYIAFQDSDDEWLATKLEKQIRYMETEALSVCFCAYTLINQSHHTVIPFDYKDKNKYEKHIVDILRHKNVVSTQTLVVKRNIIDKVGVFDEDMPRLQDYEFVIRIVEKENIGYIEESLVNVYRTKESISTNHLALFNAIKMLLEKHYNFVDISSLVKFYFANCNCIFDSEKILMYGKEFQKIINKNGRKDINILEIVIKYISEICVQKNDLLEKMYNEKIQKLKNDEFAIYGIGKVGHDIYEELRRKKVKPKGFIVTQNESENNIDDIPIYLVDEWQNKDLPVIIAVSIGLQNEILDILYKKNFQDVIIYPY